MSDDEKIKAFADMVDGSVRLTKPLEDEIVRLHEQIDKERRVSWKRQIVLGIVEALTLAVLALFIAFAYLTPVEMGQEQDLNSKTQTQEYSEGATGNE